MSHAGAVPKIPVILCIDVEPDEFYVDKRNPKPWAGFEFSHDYLKDFRSRLEERTGSAVHFSWVLRMDPQVAIAYGSAAWGADRYSAFLDAYRSMGDELGIHVHTYRWSDSRDAWLDDCGNPEWVTECLETSVASFKATFGVPSRILRFGNFWLSTSAINQAEELGIEYDLTIEPGLRSHWEQSSHGHKPVQSGPTPDYYRVPRQPYVPSRDDFKKLHADGSERHIAMIPLTSAYKELGWGPRALLRRWKRLRDNGVNDRLQSLPLSMWREWDWGDSYTAMLDRAIALQTRPYLAFAIRSDINGTCFSQYDSCLKALLNHPQASRFVFCTPAEAMRYL